MEKVSVLIKEATENLIKQNAKDSEAIFIIRYSGLSSPAVTELRQALKSGNSTLFIAKNSVARRALKSTGFQTLVDRVEGPCGIIFVKEEPVGVSKILCKFAKENEKLVLGGGLFKDRILEKKDIESLSRLPSKEILRAQVVMTLNSPVSGLVVALNQILAKLVYCLEEIKKKKPA